MKYAKVGFWLALIAFFAWWFYLVYLAATTSTPVVLARPQFLAAKLVVVGQVESLENGTVTVNDVRWPEEMKKLTGKQITVTNLSECREDWSGAGEYILPLTPEGENYSVARVPRSPGVPFTAQRPRIYRATPETLGQLEEVPRAAGKE
jgi:hypothetical protein